MASSSRTTNPLIAGVGAFVVVIGGLTIYKRYTAKPSASHPAGYADIGITAPDPETVEATAEAATVGSTVTPQHFMSVDLARAFRMVGRSNEDLLAEYGSEILPTGDAPIERQRFAELSESSYFLPLALTDNGDYNAEIGFYSDDKGKVTRLVVLTGGSETNRDNDTLATTLINQADLTWQPGVVMRNVENGLALRYTSDSLRIIATHRLTNSQWRFDISPIKKADDLQGGLGILGLGKYTTANCDVVGQTPSHLGNGKFFTIGQSQQAALAVARRLAPNQSFDEDDSELIVPSGLPRIDLWVQMLSGNVQSLLYFDKSDGQLSEQRRVEFATCWRKRVALVNEVAYWQVGNERYRVSDEDLHIARVETPQRVVQRLADGLGKADTKLADLETTTFIASTPDWPVSTELFLDDDTVTVVAANTVIGFDGEPARQAELFKEIERGLGIGKLVRNSAGVPVLQIKTKRAIIEVQPTTATEMFIAISGAGNTQR